MTGLYPSQCGVRHNRQMCSKDDQMPLRSLAQHMQDAGYQTAGFGKVHWYISSYDAPGVEVETSRRGFEIRYEARAYCPTVSEPNACQMADELPVEFEKLKEEHSTYGFGNETVEGYLGCTSEVPVEHQQEGWLTSKALKFLEEGRKPGKPFFMYLSFDAPHAGLNVPKGYEDSYKIEDMVKVELSLDGNCLSSHNKPWRFEKQWQENTSDFEKKRTMLRYYALCTYVDQLFGKVINKLHEMDELENTLIVFTSDHGEMLGERYRFSKYSFYEGSLRVPMIVSGKGVPENLKGTIDKRCASLVDIMPTLLAAAGAYIPQELVGHNLMDKPTNKGAFCELHGSGYHEIEKSPSYMWRTRNWKLILYMPEHFINLDSKLDEVKGELYDLFNDPNEFYNLYEKKESLEVREKMTRDMLMHLAISWSRFPRPCSLTALK